VSTTTRKVKWVDLKGHILLAEISYGPVAEIHGRPVAVTGVGAWPEPRSLDGHGRTRLEPGEGLLLGLTWGVPVWGIAGKDLWARFNRFGRGAIYVDDEDLLSDICQTNSPHRGTRRRTR
jgi:hypothetical protein